MSIDNPGNEVDGCLHYMFNILLSKIVPVCYISHEFFFIIIYLSILHHQGFMGYLLGISYDSISRLIKR